MAGLVCQHLRAVVAELERAGQERLSPWRQHRNDEYYTVFLAPRLDPAALAHAVAPEVLRVAHGTGCYRGPATAISCTCPDGAWQQIVLAKRRV